MRLFSEEKYLPYYNMGLLPACKPLDHVSIEYEGGSLTLRFREYNQTLQLFKKVEQYGEENVVVSSSGWFEHESTIARGKHLYFCMLATGVLMPIDTPRRDNEYGDECVVVKISNKEGED
jgi:hypothetical protein